MISGRSWLVGLTASLLALLAGCPDQGRHFGVRFVVAEGGGCGGTAPMLPIACAEVRVCESENLDACVAVAPVGGPYPMPDEPGMLEVLVSSGDSRVLRFDARVEMDVEYDIDVVAFGEDEGMRGSPPVASGHATRVRLEDGQATVWLYPTDTSACPGNTTMRLRRAFHESVTMSNGDVLVIGGVTFPDDEDGLTLSAADSASLVPADDSVLVFDARTEELVPVTFEGDPEFLPQVQRALFEGRWIDRTPDGFERVRLFGGVIGGSRMEFTSSMAGQLPARVTMAAKGRVVDIIYDSVTRTMTIEPAPGTCVAGSVGTACIVDSDCGGGGTCLPITEEVILESARTPLPATRITSFAALFGSMTSEAEVVTSFGATDAVAARRIMLPSARRGATLTRMGSRGFIVYGGNTAQAGAEQIADLALLLDPMGTRRPLTVPPEIERSIFHTASSVDDDTVLFVGGLGLDGAMVPPPARPVLRAVRLDAGGAGLVLDAASGLNDPASERIFHGVALEREPSARRNQVVVVGGSSRSAEGLQLQALDSAYRVDLDESPAVTSLPDLTIARFGHSVAPLRGGRVLVTGGLRRGSGVTPCTEQCQASSLYLVDMPEVLVVRRLPEAVECNAVAMDAGPVPMDAGRRDAPMSMSMADAGTPGPDSPMPATDAAM